MDHHPEFNVLSCNLELDEEHANQSSSMQTGACRDFN